MYRIVFSVFIYFLSSIAVATPDNELDLLSAIQKRDLAGVKQALNAGANPNIFICDKDGLYPMLHEKCQEAKQHEFAIEKSNSFEPGRLGGYFVHIGWHIKDRAMPIIAKAPSDNELNQDAEIIKMLSLAGAKFDVYGIDYFEKQKRAFFSQYFRGLSAPNQVKVAVAMLTNGFIENELPSAEASIKRLDNQIDSENNNLEIMKRVEATSANKSEVYKKQENVVSALTFFRETLKTKNNYIYSDASALDRIQKEADSQTKLRLAEEQVRLRAVVQRKKNEAAEEQVRLRAEVQRKKVEKAQIVSFRKSLQDGDDTNCGPVIEVKVKLVKVAYAVANYGNEHWIKRDEIFPAGYGCHFYNGQYEPPQ